MVNTARLAPWRRLLGMLVALLPIAAGVGLAIADDSAAACRVPPVNGLSGLYWLAAADFAPGERVSVTLAAPDGQSCPASDITSGTSTFSASVFGDVQATVAPGLCTPVQGQWTVTLQGEGGRSVSTTFAFAPNQITAVPCMPVSK